MMQTIQRFNEKKVIFEAKMDQIQYSEKYFDDINEYRHVALPAEVAKLLLKNRLLSKVKCKLMKKANDSEVTDEVKDQIFLIIGQDNFDLSPSFALQTLYETVIALYLKDVCVGDGDGENWRIVDLIVDFITMDSYEAKVLALARTAKGKSCKASADVVNLDSHDGSNEGALRSKNSARNRPRITFKRRASQDVQRDISTEAPPVIPNESSQLADHFEPLLLNDRLENGELNGIQVRLP
ncbi:hypothetical protein BUALT_Bualt07G0070700 [Buddleja alternifolia]|uniref:Cyclin-dependent kinases regulatory subunit n=1 Tax=Buddleja alternifolia TaxID=168488 RepID=A0AAV6X8Z0_9LAMI|nr:hypothetical protein BUALT_Bualt07G0070700 [Buddleja alternifolia]